MIIGFFLVESGLIEKIRNLKVIAWMTIMDDQLLWSKAYDAYETKKNGELKRIACMFVHNMKVV